MVITQFGERPMMPDCVAEGSKNPLTLPLGGADARRLLSGILPASMVCSLFRAASVVLSGVGVRLMIGAGVGGCVGAGDGAGVGDGAGEGAGVTVGVGAGRGGNDTGAGVAFIVSDVWGADVCDAGGVGGVGGRIPRFCSGCSSK